MATINKPLMVFDHHSPTFVDTWKQQAREIHALDYPLAWSEAHGGYWVMADWAATREGLANWKTFSSDNDPNGERRGGKGVTIPPQQYSLVLNESDPPIHTERRRVELPFFLPKRLREWEQVAKDFLEETLDKLKGQETCDLVNDIIIPTTARTTFKMVGYDLNEWKDAAYSAHTAVYTLPDQPGYPNAELQRLRSNFRRMIEDRKSNPRDDITSAIANTEVNGRKLDAVESESMVSALMFAGFDTTTSAAAHAFVWLDKNRDQHQRIIEDDKFADNAVDEFLRLSTPAPGIGRTVIEPIELGGRRLEPGERVYFWLAAANRDPKKFEDPERFWLERPNAREHMAFSGGSHRCLGAPLAKLELKHLLQIILQRLPNYSIDHDGITPFPSIKSTNGLMRVPVRLQA